MIEEIRIRDLGVIDEAVLPLHPGLTVLTGETGAGKTMVVTGLGLLLGSRGDAGLVRSGVGSAVVEGLVDVASDHPAALRAAEAGADVSDGLVLVRSVSAESASGTAKQIECSELPWEIRITETPSSRSAPNSRSAVPGTPIMPAPSTLTSAIRSMLVMPLTACDETGDSQMSVPGLSGANVLRIQIGIRFSTAGAIVCGWITLAPK